ncbi:MAG: TetR/AcrR family transcriptional regulator [Deltaproteobacteria bacterium]|nr:TetR/AcrR family transcriptional regulator [Deltaproteobacteria bacterium]
MTPRVVDKEEKRLAIIQAAAQVFAAKGYRAATMDQVGRQAKVGKGTVYLYFKSKEELFLAVFDWFSRDLGRQVEEALDKAGGSAKQRLSSFIESSLAAFDQMEKLFPLFMEFWAASGPGAGRGSLGQALIRFYRDFGVMIEEVIEAGVVSGEFRTDVNARAVAGVLIGALDGLCLQGWFDSEVDVQAWGRSFLEALFRGLNPRTGLAEEVGS